MPEVGRKRTVVSGGSELVLRGLPIKNLLQRLRRLLIFDGSQHYSKIFQPIRYPPRLVFTKNDMGTEPNIFSETTKGAGVDFFSSQGLALGVERFKDEIEAVVAWSARAGKPERRSAKGLSGLRGEDPTRGQNQHYFHKHASRQMRMPARIITPCGRGIAPDKIHDQTRRSTPWRAP